MITTDGITRRALGLSDTTTLGGVVNIRPNAGDAKRPMLAHES
jgi:hypothetical protein